MRPHVSAALTQPMLASRGYPVLLPAPEWGGSILTSISLSLRVLSTALPSESLVAAGYRPYRRMLLDATRIYECLSLVPALASVASDLWVVCINTCVSVTHISRVGRAGAKRKRESSEALELGQLRLLCEWIGLSKGKRKCRFH